MNRIDLSWGWCYTDDARRTSPDLCAASFVVHETGLTVPCMHTITASGVARCVADASRSEQCEPLPPTVASVIGLLNERFRAGVASNDLAATGLLLHQFDSMDDPDPQGQPWVPGAGKPVFEGYPSGDRVSATLVNAQMKAEPAPQAHRIPMYSLSLAGIILSPERNTLKCSFAFDAGTLERTCLEPSETCIPGCTHPSLRGHPALWCERNNHRWPCAWRPSDLHQMLEVREELRTLGRKPEGKFWDDHKFYDELVFDSKVFTAQLPGSMEAVFFLEGADCGAERDGPKCEVYARSAHANIKREFGLTDVQLPLVRLDPLNWKAPLSDGADPNYQSFVTPDKGAAKAAATAAGAITTETARAAAAASAAASAAARAATEAARTATEAERVTAAVASTVAPGASSSSAWSEWDALLEDDTAKFWAMWGQAYRLNRGGGGNCWDWQSGGASRFFDDTLEGRTCDRNWLEGAFGRREDRPFQKPSQALLGFDESIVELCSTLLGVDTGRGGDLNVKLADRCQRAKRNVLRLMTGSWTMCQNLEWQLCALQGKLPGQGGKAIAFATRPRDVQLEWWANPSTHPSYPCQQGGWCDPGAFTVGDVFFAEIMVAYKICSNGARLLELEIDEPFYCQLDRDRYLKLANRLQGKR
mgnify:CR=1 FL=1